MSELPKKKVIGITGSMGSGKSQVAQFIRKRYPVLDCDRINAELLEIGHEGYVELVRHKLVPLLTDGQIDKISMAKAMFSDSQLKAGIEQILHPLIIQKMKEWIDAQNNPLVFIEVPLLFETRLEDCFDSIWCVATSKELALERLQEHRHISPEKAQARLSYQMDPKKKMNRSTIVLWNDGSLKQLEKQVQQAVEKEDPHGNRQ